MFTIPNLKDDLGIVVVDKGGQKFCTTLVL